MVERHSGARVIEDQIRKQTVKDMAEKEAEKRKKQKTLNDF